MPIGSRVVMVHYVICDDCGKRGPVELHQKEAIDRVRDLGWRVTGHYLCPKCIEKREGVSAEGYFV